MDNNVSRNIPFAIKREVRQRCGFGCIFCGLPLYEYEHMLGWANVHEHKAEDITLLCDRHHREKTSGLLPVESVRKADSDPYNKRVGVSKPYNLHYEGNFCAVEIGSNAFVTAYRGPGTYLPALLIDGNDLLSFHMEEQQLFLNMTVLDIFNSPVLVIQNNELVYSVSPWDITFEGTKLTIREEHRKLLLEVIFRPPNTIAVTRGRFLCNGVEVVVKPDKVIIPGVHIHISDLTSIGINAGIIIGNRIPGLFGNMYISQVSRYGNEPLQGPDAPETD